MVLRKRKYIVCILYFFLSSSRTVIMSSSSSSTKQQQQQQQHLDQPLHRVENHVNMYAGKRALPYYQLIFPPNLTREQQDQVFETLNEAVQVHCIENRFRERIPIPKDQNWALISCKTGYHNEHRGRAVVRFCGVTKTQQEAVALAQRLVHDARMGIENETAIILPAGLAHEIRDTSCRTPYTTLIAPEGMADSERQSLNEIQGYVQQRKGIMKFLQDRKKEIEQHRRSLMIKYANCQMDDSLNQHVEREIASKVYDIPSNGNLPTRVRERMRASVAEDAKRFEAISLLSLGIKPKDPDEFHFFCEKQKGDFFSTNKYLEYSGGEEGVKK